VPLLLGAAQQHVTNGWLLSAPGGGFEFPVFWAVALVVQALLGSGPYALDAAIERNVRSARRAAA
jgi:putative oxidoreductase